MKVLMIDVGGTNVKMMASGHEGFRKFPSGPDLTPAQMVRGVRKATKDWDYEVVSIGFPGLVRDGKPSRNPPNLGNGWVGYNFEKGFKKKVRFMNDAAMQALANYNGGRMLFIGLGTSLGSTLIADDLVVPLEIGAFRLNKTDELARRVDKESLSSRGQKRWEKAVWKTVQTLRDVFCPDDVMIGGGNASKLKNIPEGIRVGDNQDTFRGAIRLWPDADFIAEQGVSTWRIVRPKTRGKLAKKKQKK